MSDGRDDALTCQRQRGSSPCQAHRDQSRSRLGCRRSPYRPTDPRSAMARIRHQPGNQKTCIPPAINHRLANPSKLPPGLPRTRPGRCLQDRPSCAWRVLPTTHCPADASGVRSPQQRPNWVPPRRSCNSNPAYGDWTFFLPCLRFDRQSMDPQAQAWRRGTSSPVSGRRGTEAMS